MRYICYAVAPGVSVRHVGEAEDPFEALAIGRREAHHDEALSVNREDRPAPSIRAGEALAGIGAPLTRDECTKKYNSRRGAELSRARWAKRQRRLGA
jgi:hypothetical protein